MWSIRYRRSWLEHGCCEGLRESQSRLISMSWVLPGPIFLLSDSVWCSPRSSTISFLRFSIWNLWARRYVDTINPILWIESGWWCSQLTNSENGLAFTSVRWIWSSAPGAAFWRAFWIFVSRYGETTSSRSMCKLWCFWVWTDEPTTTRTVGPSVSLLPSLAETNSWRVFYLLSKGPGWFDATWTMHVDFVRLSR